MPDPPTIVPVMPLHQTPAFTLRTYPLAEADLIVVFYTRDHGQVRGVARGARRLRSRFGSAFQPLTLTNLVFYQKERSSLARVSSCEIERSYYTELTGLEEAALAAYLAELVQEFTGEGDSHPDLFRLLGVVLKAIADGVPLAVAARYFEVWVLRLSGLLPRLATCGACGRALGRGRWVAQRPLEFICSRSCGDVRGKCWLSPAGTDLLRSILKQTPDRVAGGAGRDRKAVNRLGLVSRVLIRGHLERDLRSYRYLDRLRRAGPGVARTGHGGRRTRRA